MAKEDELFQVSISLPNSHVSILPELMKVVATACSSSYCWDSMKLSVNSQVPSDRGSRIIVNLGKRVTPESEVIQGMIHKCRESVCKHANPSQDVVGEVRMTSFSRRTLKEHLKELTKSDEEEIKGTGWLEKDVSNEMFYPSWYDELRMKSVSQLGDAHFPEKQLSSTSPVLIVNNVNVHHFYESESEEFFPLKSYTKAQPNKIEEISDETFRLKKVVDRAKNYVDPEVIPSANRNSNPQSPIDMKMKIRKLKERLDPSDMYEESILYIKDSGKGDSKERDYSYRQYLCYDDDLPPYPICDTDESSLNEHRIMEFPSDSYHQTHDLQETFMRQSPQENLHNRLRPKKARERDEDSILVLSKTAKKTKFHRSYSANAVSQSFEGSRDFSPSKKKEEEKKRPKSGPEKRVEFIGSPEVDVFSKGDSKKISEVHRPSNKTTSSRKKMETKDAYEGQDQQKEKKKKRKSHHASEKMLDESMPKESVSNDHKELVKRTQEKRVKEKGHRGGENESKSPKLVISYKSYDEGLDKSKSNHRSHDQDEKKLETKHHKKSKKVLQEKIEKSDLYPKNVVQQEERTEGRRSRGKEDARKQKRPKSEKDDHHKIKRSEVIEMNFDKSKNVVREHKRVKEGKQNPESTKSWKKGLLGKRMTSPVVREETQPTTEEHVSIELDEKTSKRAMSFLEIISVMADEVKQLGKRKDHKRIRDKVS